MPPLPAMTTRPLQVVSADEDVEVRVDPVGWRWGFVRQWALYAEIGWVATVTYNRAAGENCIGSFLAEDVLSQGNGSPITPPQSTRSA